MTSLRRALNQQARFLHRFESGGSKVLVGTTPAARITLSTPAAKPSSKKTIIPQGEMPKPAIDHPADRRADQDSGHEFGREPKATGDRRRIGGRRLTRDTFGGTVGMNVAEPFAEALEPCGERRLVR